MTLRIANHRGTRTAPGARAVGRLVLFAATIGSEIAIVVLSLASKPSATKYGSIPSWIPHGTVAVGRVLVASPAHPALGIEGDAMNVDLTAGHVTALAVGPIVPEEGEFPVPATSPVRFAITFTNVSGTVPISASDFTILDERGLLHHPQVMGAGGLALPSSLSPGRSLKIIVNDVVPTGAGDLRWSPGSRTPVVSWDFDVEID